MSIIRAVPEDEATGMIADIYAGDVHEHGFVAAHTKVLALNPEAYLAWEQLISAIARPMGARRYELVTLAAARGARSKHCRLAHGTKSLAIFSEEQLERVAEDYRDAELSPAEVVMMIFAENVSADASSMTDRDALPLRNAGFTDREIVDIAICAAARNYYSRAVQALGVEVEVPAELSPRLRDALIAGL
ncbi:carboxymuconolactone decarboxylase family protein [Microbacteriaceae bacterium VKM Ac-2855]|nr:carboxymuconolactone decarboxylase family protein [Microbacteriaceae bacterium VKM Ac-2855]